MGTHSNLHSILIQESAIHFQFVPLNDKKRDVNNVSIVILSVTRIVNTISYVCN